MPISWKVIAALVVAGGITLVIALGVMSWWNEAGIAFLKARGLELLSLPGLALFLVLLGFVWYQLFSTALHLLGDRDRG